MSAVPALEIRLFGQARVSAAGEPVKFAKRAATVAMLAYLVLKGGAPVAREHLAFTLFPDLDEEAAVAELRRYLYLLQKSLPPSAEPYIVADSESLRWNRSAAALIDVYEFERLAKDGARAREAIDYYAGDLLEDLYDDWVIGARERFRTLYLDTLSATVARCRSERSFSEAIGFARRLLVAEPWREDVVRQLMAARFELGDASGALAEYGRFAQRARDELQTEPMPETRALRDAIARGAILPSSLDVGMRERQGQRLGIPFAGRALELERLRHAWDRAARGHGTTVFVCGEPGIGKSRLAAEFSLRVDAEGGRVVAGSTSYPERMPYQCLIDALRDAQPFIAPLKLNALDAALLARLVPELSRPAGAAAADAPALDPERERARIFDAFCRTFERLARARPTLLVLEDLHWAGPATVALLRSIGRYIRQAPLLVLATYRDNELSRAHALTAAEGELLGERAASRISLGRLNEAEAAPIFEAFSALEEGGRRDLLARSEGNPLFLIQSMLQIAETRGPGEPAGDIATLIGERLAQLSPGARRVAEVAAVCGNNFHIDVVRDVCGDSRAEVFHAVDELLDRHLVREAGPGGLTYAFSHHLIAAVTYASLGEENRRLRHERAARVLAEAPDARASGASGVARHFALAGSAAQASAWYGQAAIGAALVLAHDDAAALAQAALDASADPDADIALLFLRESANAQLGRRTDQLADLERLERGAEGPILYETLRRRIEVSRALDDHENERAAIETLQVAAARESDRYWSGIAAVAEARRLAAAGQYAAALQTALIAEAVFSARGDASELIDALTVLVECAGALGDLERVDRALAEARTIANTTDSRLRAKILMQSSAAAIPAQRFTEAARFGRAALEEFRAQGDRVGEAFALAAIATSAVRLSHWEDARAANLAAADIFERIDNRRGLTRVLMNLAMLHGRFGDFDRSQEFLERSHVLAVQLGDARAEAAVLLNLSFVALWKRESERARDLATRALEHALLLGHTPFRAQALANLGAAERDLGSEGGGIERMEEGLALSLSLGRLTDAANDLADLALAYAQVGDLGRALGRAEEVLAIDRAWTAAAIFPPYPLWTVATILRAAGDARARDVLLEADRLATAHAASIDDDELRTAFLRLPFVAAIKKARAQDVWPAFAAPELRSAPV